jgi:stage III sporulation protein AG
MGGRAGIRKISDNCLRLLLRQKMGGQKRMKNLHQWIRGKKWRNMKKDQWLIVFLAGVLLLVIAVPTDCGTSFSTKTDDTASEQKTDTQEVYEEQLEERLERVLSSMEGVGAVEVMITFQDGGESIVEKDVSTTGETQTDTDSEGNDTQQTKSERSEETVYTQESGEEEPFVSKEIFPEIEGVLVVAQGGDDSTVAKNISEAVEALFGLEVHKIKVVKMNLQEGAN